LEAKSALQWHCVSVWQGVLFGGLQQHQLCPAASPGAATAAAAAAATAAAGAEV